MIEERDITNFQDYLDWSEISKNKTLSEDFICEFQEKVDWKYISWEKNYQKTLFVSKKIKLIGSLFQLINHYLKTL